MHGTLPPLCRRVLASCLLLLAASAPAGLLDTSGFNFKVNLQVVGYTQPEVLTDFPVLIKLGPGVPGFSYSQFLSPGGGDLRFASETGEELNYEIDTWNPAGDSYVWVQVPTMSASGTPLTAYWGKAGLPAPAYTQDGSTWSNGYAGVWHLNQPNAMNSVNGLAGTSHGNVTTPGFLGSAQYFSTNTYNTYLELGNLQVTNLTLEAWTLHANPRDFDPANANVDDVVFRKEGSFQWYQWNMDYNLNLDITCSGTNYNFQVGGIPDLNVPDWTCEAVSYDSATGTGRGYMNGVIKYALTKGPNVPVQNDFVCTIGKKVTGTGSYYGGIDEVRLSRVVRSDNWLKACYQNQFSPETYVTFDVTSGLSVAPDSPGHLLLTWLGAEQTLQVSADPADPKAWTTNGLPEPVVSNGTNRVTVTCTGGAAFYRLAILPKDFNLAVSPNNLTLPQSGAGGCTITIGRMNYFNNPVLLTVAGVPAGVSAFMSPATTRTTAGLSFSVAAGATVGSFPVTITGTSGTLVHSTNITLTITPTVAGSAYTWPPYIPNLNYDFRTDYPVLNAPTNYLDDCANVVETITSGWWCFRYGPDKNPLVTAAAWNPLLARMNQDFAYFRDVMGWPPDKRAKNGKYSAIYLFGSGLCTDTASNTNLGGWQGNITYKGQDWPMVLLSYYPVYSFDPACTYGDRLAQQSDCVHEGIHAVLADMPGCKNAAWFQEGGNTWLQGTAYALQSGNYSSMGWLSAGAMVAPFMPIECYSGWLQDDSFGGPSDEGVHQVDANNTELSTWRELLGGSQYGETLPHFMGEIVSPGSVAWIWQNCTSRVLEGLATAPGGLGDAQTRRLIREYRARQAFCDFGRWSPAYKLLLDNNWCLIINAQHYANENPPIWINCAPWKATCYAWTTNNNNTLTPERRTLPGWSGANQVPLKVNPTAGTVSVNFTPLGNNMSCQIVYRASDGLPVYSVPVSNGTCSLTLSKTMKTNVVIAVVCNTDYTYTGDYSRTNKFDYRLTFGTGVTNTADIYTKWY